MRPHLARLALTALLALPAVVAAPAAADTVVPDDQVVQGSQCLGLDCVDNESFGFDTLRLQENTTRIAFDDTSASAGFPANDWALQANESPYGGINAFLLQDVTGATTPFKVFAGAPTDALAVAGTGWLGVGTAAPAAPLHVKRTDGTAKLLVEEASATTADRTLAELVNSGAVALRFTDTRGTSWLAGSTGSGGFAIRRADGTAPFALSAGGDARAAGTLQQAADPAAAGPATAVDGDATLAALRALAVQVHAASDDPGAAKHLWPSGAAFRAAFGLGDDDATLAPGDVASVALVAVKALDARLTKALEDRPAQGPAGATGTAGATGATGAAGRAGAAASTARVKKLERKVSALAKTNKSLAKRLARLEKALKR
jgi:hypothetical protein